MSPMTDPTRDEAVRSLIERYDAAMACQKESPDASLIVMANYGDLAINHLRAMLASAPAPASGGVAAVVAEELAIKIVLLSVNWLRDSASEKEHEDYVRANWTKEIAEAKRLILASLSPAATPVSEAGGELHHASGERITRKDLNDAYRKGAEDGRLATKLIDGMRPEALAKPASSPAGGDVGDSVALSMDSDMRNSDFETWACKRGYLMHLHEGDESRRYRYSLTEEAWLGWCAALSQSTSAGRGTDDAS